MAFLIEHYAGAFPTWLAPVQVAIVPVGEAHVEAAQALQKALRTNDIRPEQYFDSNSLGKRIHGAKHSKPPYVVVLGNKEIESGEYAIELRSGEKISLTQEALIARIQDEIKNRTNN